MNEYRKLNDLPEGWKWLSLSEIGIPSNESIIPAKHENELFEVWSVPNYEKDEPELLKGTEIGSNKIVVYEGDVLLCKINPRINRVWQVRRSKGFKQIASTEWVVVRNRDFNASFLVYQLQSQKVRNDLLKDVSGVGGSLMRARPNAVKNLKLSIPHREVQDQIVAKIEELFSELDKGIEELKSAQQQLKVYRQAVLKWAFEGKLNNKNVKDGELPKGWKWVELNHLAKIISGYAFKSTDFKSQGVPVIKISNIGYSEFVWKDQVFLPESYLGQQKNFVVQSEDLLIALTRPITNNTTKVCRYPKNATPGLLNQRVALVKEMIGDKEYLFWYFQTDSFKNYIKSKFSETLQPNLSPKDLAQMPIPFCAIEEQQQIIQEIESRLSVCDKIEETINDSLKQAEALRQSILKKAFDGKL